MAKENKPISGRQRLQWPTLSSIKQAAAMLHYTEDEIKLCKNSGSKAFLDSGRIVSDMLIRDLNDLLHKPSDLPEGFVSWKEFGESRRAKLADVELQEKQKSVMPTVEAVAHAGEACGLFMSQLERLARELPPALSGLPASGVASRLESEIENIRRHLKIKLAEIGK